MRRPNISPRTTEALKPRAIVSGRRPVTVWLSGCCVLLSLLLAAGCGYHVGGKSNVLPPTLHTVAVPAFKNETGRFKVEQVLTRAVVREMMSRTSYRIQPEPAGADAVLNGTVTQFWTSPVVVEPSVGRTLAVSVNVHARVRLTDTKTGKLLYDNPDFIFTDTYEISGQAATYFEESGPGLERLARTFANHVVSAMLEAF